MKIKVQNPTPQVIERGARIFAPHSVSEEIDVSNHQYFQIKAHSKLSVEKVIVDKVVDSVDNSENDEKIENTDAEPETESDPEVEEGTEEETEESTSCPFCDFEAKTSGGLTTHIRSKHDEEE